MGEAPGAGPVIVVSAITRRVVDAWRPMLDALEARGARIELLLFRREADPDSAGLDALPWPVRLSLPPPIDDEFWPVAPALEAVNATLRASFTERPADAVLCCTANIAPENQLRTALADVPNRPMIVGLQHGFVQWWLSYTRTFDYDLFGVFGEAFVEKFEPAQRPHVLALGMTELAALPRDAPPGRDLLFVAQETPGPEVVGPLLEGLGERLGLTPRLRPHPEHRAVFAALEGRVAVSRSTTIAEDMAHADVVVSTGSTAVLKALAMGRRVVVLPFQGGETFADLGVVAADANVDAALAVLARQAEPDFPAVREAFLDRWCGGVADDAPSVAADRLLAVVAERRAAAL